MSIQISKFCPKCQSIRTHEQTSTGSWRCVNCGSEQN